MNISRINPINFNGYLKFQCNNRTNPTKVDTKDVIATGVGEAWSKDYHELEHLTLLLETRDAEYDARFYANNFLTQEDITLANKQANGNKYKAQKILNKKFKEKFENTINKQYKQWFTDAKAADGDVDCPFFATWSKKRFTEKELNGDEYIRRRRGHCRRIK